MKINTKEIYDKLPASWEELKLKDFKKITNVEIVEHDELTEDLFIGTDNTLRTIGALSDTPFEILEMLPFNSIKMLADKISFLSVAPDIDEKSSIDWKKPDEITYSDFTFYQRIAHDLFGNIELVIKSFSKNKLSDEEILNLPMTKIHSGFFFLKKDVNRYLNRMIFCTAKTAAMQMVKNRLHKIRSKRK